MMGPTAPTRHVDHDSYWMGEVLCCLVALVTCVAERGDYAL